MGRGFPVTDLKKQELNTRRSNESEVVGFDDFMPGMFWTRNFMKSQDYDVLEDDIFHNIIILGFHEIPLPKNSWHKMINSNHFRFGGALGIQLLFL